MKLKIHFGRKQKKTKMTKSPFSALKMKTNFGRLLVWWLDLTDPNPADFTTYLRHWEHWCSQWFAQ